MRAHTVSDHFPTPSPLREAADNGIQAAGTTELARALRTNKGLQCLILHCEFALGEGCGAGPRPTRVPTIPSLSFQMGKMLVQGGGHLDPRIVHHTLPIKAQERL
jgi:hypothetical protein